jgi:subtilase family serine protease
MLLAFAAAFVPPAAGAAKPSRRAVPGSAPRWATPGRDRGRADTSKDVTITVYLALRDAAGAEALARAVSTPGDAAYGHYLTPAQVKSRFRPTDADVAAVRKFLTSAGLSVDDVAGDNDHVEASGSLGAAAAAFGVDVHRYAYRGRLLDAPTGELTVPDSLSGAIAAVAGLDQSGVLKQPLGGRHGGDPVREPPPNAPVSEPARHAGAAPPPDAFVNAPPCSTYFGEKIADDLPPVNGVHVPYAPCGYTPAQFQGAYGVAPLIAGGLDGRGVTVAITDAYAAPTILQDANTYAANHGQAPFAGGQFSQLTPKKKYRYGYDDARHGDLCGEQGWYGEETLDVEAVHAMAPAANVLYVAGRSCDDPDLLKALDKIVEHRRADIITNSWGSTGEDTPQQILRAYHQTFLAAALEGIGVLYSSGDDGDDSLDTADGSPAADFPSTEPLVTAVGGTSLGVNADNSYGFETGWATGTSSLNATKDAWVPPWPGDFLYGGGGGVSTLFPEPFYQFGVVPPAIAHGHRATPDVAMDGDPQTGMLVGETQTFPDGSTRYSEYRLGGTSLASPLFAGVRALADQAAGHPLGFVNPAIYRLAGTPAVHDVSGPAPVPAVVRVNYNNSVDATDGTSPILRSLDDEAQSLHVAPGWDNLTGVGTPNDGAFVAGLAGGR